MHLVHSIHVGLCMCTVPRRMDVPMYVCMSAVAVTKARKSNARRQNRANKCAPTNARNDNNSDKRAQDKSAQL